MMTFSDAALKEMGLHPLWKARGAVAADTPQLIDYIEKNSVAPAPLKADRHAAIMRMDYAQLQHSITACTECSLHQARRQAVPGAGAMDAQWMLVGEGPGVEEDETGEPFVGQAGKLLDNMLAAIDLSREKNMFITNAVKCHPPQNRHPAAKEIACCAAYLERQIQLIQPKLIIALGKVAADQLLGGDATIASLRGTIHSVQGIPMIVTYHPAYLFRTPADKAKAWEDLCFARTTMANLLAHTHASV